MRICAHVARLKVANKKEEDRVSPIPSVESPDPATPPPLSAPPPPLSVQHKTNLSSEPNGLGREDQTVQSLPASDLISSQQVKQPNFASFGNLSSESSASESESSSDSDNEELVHKKPSDHSIKTEETLNVGESSGVLITPLGEPNIKQEGVASGDALMNMLSQDLDISSDSDSD